jgi:hypothetical protein
MKKEKAKPAGNLLRWTGDKIRTKGDVGDYLTKKGMNAAAGFAVKGISANNVVKEVEGSEGLLSSTRNVAGNGLRWLGECCVGETPCLERSLRDFWMDKGTHAKEDADEILISTACALFLSDDIQGTAEIKHMYRRFLAKCNGSSYLPHSNDDSHNDELLIRGIIRGYAMKLGNKVDINNISASMIGMLGDEIQKLPILCKITAESVVPDDQERGKMSANVLNERVIEARKNTFLNLVKESYDRELIVINADLTRLDLLNGPKINSIEAPKNNNNNNNEDVD